MCGRYYIEEEYSTSQLLQMIIEAREKAARAGETLKTGEIFPTNVAPVVALNRKREKSVFPMKWGFSYPEKKTLVINARCETAAQKPLFKEAMRDRRCAVPASGYYEWRGKEKFGITARSKAVFMAGIYRFENERAVFCILTTSPTEEISKIHGRMPLMLDEKAINGWIAGDIMVEEVASAAKPDYIIAVC